MTELEHASGVRFCACWERGRDLWKGYLHGSFTMRGSCGWGEVDAENESMW